MISYPRPAALSSESEKSEKPTRATYARMLCYRFPLLCMHVGDSFVVATERDTNRAYAQAKRDKVEIRARHMRRGGWRVWRSNPTAARPSTVCESLQDPKYAVALVTYPINKGVTSPAHKKHKKVAPPTPLVTAQVADAGPPVTPVPSVPSVRLQATSEAVTPRAKRPAHVADTAKEYTFIIEKGIKPPPPKVALGFGLTHAISKLEVGDSFIAPLKTSTGAYRAAKSRKIKCVTRKTPEGIRVWRVA